MTTLSDYLTDTRQYLGTVSAGLVYSAADLTNYINRARRQVAIEGQCIRSLPPISGSITAITLGSAGSGYTVAPTVTVSGPDMPSGLAGNPAGLQATAVATISGGAVNGVTISNAGAGYFAPVVTITSGNGTGATAIANVSGVNGTTTLQEKYTFAAVNPMVAVSGSGIQSIFMVSSISVLWGTFRYTLARMGFGEFQARFRNYAAGFYGPPAAFCNFDQGINGSVYVRPIPDQRYAWEWDVCCIPWALANDTDPEPIPYPWTDAVAYLAAYYALLGAQRSADADKMYEHFERCMKRARAFSSPGVVRNWYGRL